MTAFKDEIAFIRSNSARYASDPEFHAEWFGLTERSVNLRAQQMRAFGTLVGSVTKTLAGWRILEFELPCLVGTAFKYGLLLTLSEERNFGFCDRFYVVVISENPGKLPAVEPGGFISDRRMRTAVVHVGQTPDL